MKVLVGTFNQDKALVDRGLLRERTFVWAFVFKLYWQQLQVVFAAAGCYHGSRLASLQLHAFHLSAERGLVQGALHLHRRSLLTIIPSVLTGLPAFMFTFTNPFFRNLQFRHSHLDFENAWHFLVKMSFFSQSVEFGFTGTNNKSIHVTTELYIWPIYLVWGSPLDTGAAPRSIQWYNVKTFWREVSSFQFSGL